MYIVNIIDFFHRSIHMHLPRVKPRPAFTINFACGVFFLLALNVRILTFFMNPMGDWWDIKYGQPENHRNLLL